MRYLLLLAAAVGALIGACTANEHFTPSSEWEIQTQIARGLWTMCYKGDRLYIVEEGIAVSPGGCKD